MQLDPNIFELINVSDVSMNGTRLDDRSFGHFPSKHSMLQCWFTFHFRIVSSADADDLKGKLTCE